MAAKVLLIGGGSREHALASKLTESVDVGKIYVSPGNAGTDKINNKTENIDLPINEHNKILEWCHSNNIDLVVIGPEAPLANGLADILQTGNIDCFGPSKLAAQIEASKSFSKSFMQRHDVPTASYKSFTSFSDALDYIDACPFDGVVVKASGLAAGKGVVVADSKAEAKDAVKEIMEAKKYGDAGDTVVIEEKMYGEEISVFAFCDGDNVSTFPPAQDFKRAHDGNLGPNTGGMGAYCPVKHVPEEILTFVKEQVIQKTVTGMKAEGYPFVGLLYAGLMLTKDGPKVLEFNCRFGDPETQVVLSLLKSDLYHVMKTCCKGTLSSINPIFDSQHTAVTVVCASGGYPGPIAKGKTITGLDDVKSLPNIQLFHAGTKQQDDDVIVTSGGRVLSVVATGLDIAEARSRVYDAVEKIHFDGMFYRKDIALVAHGSHRGIGYYDCGVDIAAGNHFVDAIKPLAHSTKRSGCMSGLGGFGGLFDLKACGYKDPILVSGTDGVGTKLKIAVECRRHDSVGIDLVAMCVNDILAQGGEPLFFLDYYACGKLEPAFAKDVVGGVAEGCSLAGCALLGGETAEMPGMYKPGDYDIAGFAVGAVERDQILPKLDNIQHGDIVIGLKSSGIHSNGFSLVRKVVELSGYKYSDLCPYKENQVTLGYDLLTPTKIYTKAVLPLMKRGLVKGFAHITGGGLVENIPRVLPNHLKCMLDANKWEVGSVFGWLADVGRISEDEMLRTFNCGLGGVLIVDAAHEGEVLKLLEEAHECGYTVGRITDKVQGEPQVQVSNFGSSLKMALNDLSVQRPFKIARTQRMKVGVLISGSGTNLQSLIDQSLKPESSAEIVLVISNVASAYGLQRAIKVGIPTKVINHKDYKKRVDFDMELLATLKEAGVELVCLAGFMRILTGNFVSAWPGRLINIHPSLLPSFKGMDAHKQVLEAGVRISGCTAHFVVEEVDAGGIIAQDSVQVLPGDTIESLQERVKTKEWEVYPRAMELVASGKIRVVDGAVQFT